MNATHVAFLLAPRGWLGADGIGCRVKVPQEGVERESALIEDIGQRLARHGATCGYGDERRAALHPKYIASLVEPKHPASLEGAGALVSGASR